MIVLSRPSRSTRQLSVPSKQSLPLSLESKANLPVHHLFPTRNPVSTLGMLLLQQRKLDLVMASPHSLVSDRILILNPLICTTTMVLPVLHTIPRPPLNTEVTQTNSTLLRPILATETVLSLTTTNLRITRIRTRMDTPLTLLNTLRIDEQNTPLSIKVPLVSICLSYLCRFSLTFSLALLCHSSYSLLLDTRCTDRAPLF